jgi:hypothetical protein
MGDVAFVLPFLMVGASISIRKFSLGKPFSKELGSALILLVIKLTMKL